MLLTDKDERRVGGPELSAHPNLQAADAIAQSIQN
jgi:hypothetical protein